MKLSKTATHAALALVHLASCPADRPVQGREVARHLGLPADSALKILQALARDGLIQSQLGRGGGYHLHQPPEEIRLLDIIEAIEGPVAAEIPVTPSHPNLAGSVELLREACDQTARRLRAELSRVTLADLLSVQPHELVASL